MNSAILGRLPILDASVAASFLFDDAHSGAALEAVSGRADWTAPGLILLEVANVAARHVRRGELTLAGAERAQEILGALLVEVAPVDPLVRPALRLAAAHGFSIYDAVYLALAEREGRVVLTADGKFARRAEEVGLSNAVRTL